MILKTRFKRLTLWNKLGAIGAICSIVALPIALWSVFGERHVKNFVWADALNDLASAKEAKQDSVIASRTFWLLRDEGATFSLGPCPGEACYEFRLGETNQTQEGLQQRIYMRGSGFGVTNEPGLFHIGSRLHTKGSSLQFVQSTGEMWTTLKLTPESHFKIETEKAVIAILVVDTRAESLRIRVELTPSNYKPTPGVLDLLRDRR